MIKDSNIRILLQNVAMATSALELPIHRVGLISPSLHIRDPVGRSFELNNNTPIGSLCASYDLQTRNRRWLRSDGKLIYIAIGPPPSKREK